MFDNINNYNDILLTLIIIFYMLILLFSISYDYYIKILLEYKRQVNLVNSNGNALCSFTNILNNKELYNLIYLKKQNGILHVFKINNEGNIIDLADGFYGKFDRKISFNKFKVNKIISVKKNIKDGKITYETTDGEQKITILFIHNTKLNKTLYFKTGLINNIYLHFLKYININIHFKLLIKTIGKL